MNSSERDISDHDILNCVRPAAQPTFCAGGTQPAR